MNTKITQTFLLLRNTKYCTIILFFYIFPFTIKKQKCYLGLNQRLEKKGSQYKWNFDLEKKKCLFGLPGRF